MGPNAAARVKPRRTASIEDVNEVLPCLADDRVGNRT